MTVLLWPPELPKPDRGPYRSQFEDPRLKRRAETGPRGSVRRYSSAACQVSLSVNLSRAQMAVFDKFFEDETEMGSLPFVMPDPLSDGWKLLDPDGTPLLDPDGQQILISAYWLCQFGSTMPVHTISGIRFIVSFPVLVMP